MKIKAGIVGATGYAGAELSRLLSAHPQVELTVVTSQTYADKSLHEVYGNFRGFDELVCSDMTVEEASELCDVLFLALPHGLASHQVTPEILQRCKIIDLGADYRLKDPHMYQRWYKTTHGSPKLVEQAVYGLSEWFRDEVAASSLIANPGCYTTCSILTLAPLVRESLINPDTIIIDAKSGVTGAGRKATAATLYAECNESIKAYSVATHRHTPEIEEQLSRLAANSIEVSFTPHLVPMNRGILVTAYAKVADGVDKDDIIEAYAAYYKDEQFIRLLPYGTFPETRWVKGSNICDIGFTIDERTNRIVAGGAIDNLVKGASGQALQNMNIMFSLPEETGLATIPGFPV
ncbi:MAG: N-acetyl-gamma-glutamyl-phosphate reductase [Spirochaetota bacterium]